MMNTKRPRALRLWRQRRPSTTQLPPHNPQPHPLTDLEQEAAQLLATLRSPATPPPSSDVAWQWADSGLTQPAPVVRASSDGVRERLRGRGDW